jgi:hypothetical protein
VQIPELDGQTFIELETMAEPEDVSTAVQVVRDVLAGSVSASTTSSPSLTRTGLPPSEAFRRGRSSETA